MWRGFAGSRYIRYSAASARRASYPNLFSVGAEEDASELASFFGSVFKEEPYGPLEKDYFKRVENFSEIGPLTISVEDVQSELLALNVDKSPGPYGVHPQLLRSLAADPSFVSAVHALFVKCATDRKIPA